MRGKTTLFVDQYGSKVYAKTVKELVTVAGGGKVSKMYQDGMGGLSYHVGYVVGKRWFTAFVPFSAKV